MYKPVPIVYLLLDYTHRYSLTLFHSYVCSLPDTRLLYKKNKSKEKEKGVKSRTQRTVSLIRRIAYTLPKTQTPPQYAFLRLTLFFGQGPRYRNVS